MVDGASKTFHALSWLAVVLTGLATAYWVAIIVQGNYCWSAFGFTLGMAAPLGGATMVLALLPSGYLYLQKRQRRDLTGFWLAAGSILTLLIEAVLVCCVIPQRSE